MKKKKISDVIPSERLESYLNLYHFIRSFPIELNDFPYEEFGKILIALNKLVEKGFCNQFFSEKVQESIITHIYEIMGYSPLVKQALVKRGAPRYHALDALIYCLISDLRYSTGKPNYELARAFLIENNTITEAYSFDDLQKRFKRLKSKDVALAVRLILATSISPSGDLPIKLFDGESKHFPMDHPFMKLILPETIL